MLTFAPSNTQPLLLDVRNTTLIVTPAEFDLLTLRLLTRSTEDF
jgi:hypothetical protein